MTPSADDRAPWVVVPKFHPAAVALADRHYSRRKVGSPQFMPPGQTLVLLARDGDAVFGWWRPHPASGLKAMNNLDGWTCTIFRNEGRCRASGLILAAEDELLRRHDCGPDGLLTYVWPAKLRGRGQPGFRPGWCFLKAGWREVGNSADGRKLLFRKGAASPAPELPLFAEAA